MIVCTKFRIKVIIGVCVAIAAIVLTCCLVPTAGKKLDFKATFYYVCYDSPKDSHSASSMSSAVQSYGGAGYVVCCNDKYYVTVSCYYKDTDAETVCAALKQKGLNCTVVKVEREDYKLKGSAKKNAEKYQGNLNTLLSVSKICYNLANSLDAATQSQSGAKSVLADVKTDLNSLLRLNGANCFAEELSSLIAECDDVSEGIILAREVRRLQVAVCDSIINVKLY